MTSPVQQTDEEPVVEPETPAGLELPPRPRRRLIAPAPLSLLAVVLIAGGFIGGAHVEKGQATSGAAAGASRLSAPGGFLPAGAKSSGAAASSTRPTSGKVMGRSGKTLYVTGSEGDKIRVATSAATSVTKTMKAKVKAIHPGETVTITGTTNSKGAVSAGSISVGSDATGTAGVLGAG
jgi:hypothetical protein